MQHIQIIIINENGQMIKSSDINYVDIYEQIYKLSDWKNFQWASSIDPYGDTYFNVHQVPYLKKDLEDIATLLPSVKDKINSLIEFIDNVDQHLYLKFLGD